LKQKNCVIYYIILSGIISIFLFFINYFSISSNKIDYYEKIVISIIFIIICIIGSSLSFKPRWYKRIKKTSSIDDIKIKKISREGHHPSCEKFKNHVIMINNKTYCSGCLGLAIGAFLSIILILFYNIINTKNMEIYNYFIFIGLIMVFFSFFESMLYNRNPLMHLISNIILINGFLFIVISTLENSDNLIFGLISIFVIFIFLETRIQISLLNHRNICINCQNDCKINY
jgi:hypothetical protein